MCVQNGALGRGTTSSKLLYRSYFPTVLTRWWKERVLHVGKWMCFDACPLPACLPFTAKRMAKLTPNAKLIFMVGVIFIVCMMYCVGQTALLKGCTAQGPAATSRLCPQVALSHISGRAHLQCVTSDCIFDKPSFVCCRSSETQLAAPSVLKSW